MHLVMKDYHSKFAKENLDRNAEYWANYLIKHSGNQHEDFTDKIDHIIEILPDNVKLSPSDVKKTLEVMIEGVNWAYNVYWPDKNKLMTGLVKQQYLTLSQLKVFIADFEFNVLNNFNSSEFSMPSRSRLISIFVSLQRHYAYGIFSRKNAKPNLDAVQYILKFVNQFVD